MTEETKLKKGKKNKNAKASLQKSTCVNDRILTVLSPEEQSCVQAGEKAGKKKKKKKEKNANECLFNTTNGEDISKAKKKKIKQDGASKMEAPLGQLKEDNKKRKKSPCPEIEHVGTDEEEELPKKSKKKKNAETVERKKEKKKNTADEKTCDVIEEKHSKKHKKSSEKVAENQETTEETGGSEEVKKSKTDPRPVKNKKAKTREHGNKVTVAEMEDVEEKNENPAKSGRMKGGKKKPKELAVECADVEEPQLRQKKKSKKHRVPAEAEPPSVTYEEQQREEKLTGTGRKTRKRNERTTTADAPAEHPCSGNAPKPKKIKKVKEEVEDQNEPSQMDVAPSSVRNGNTDGVTINQGLGQWSTAQFDSSEKQQKFLRLMGGFKKEFQPAAAAAATRSNMALGLGGQQQLQQKLLDQFDRAHSRRLDSSNRGAGIGFTAPVNKKFFIDVNASRSVRFDD